MRKFAVPLAAACFLVAVPASAPAEPVRERAASVDGTQIVERFYRALYARKYDQALREIRGLNPSPSDPGPYAFVSAMRASALLGLERDSEARELISRIDKLAVDDPSPRMMLFEAGLLSERYDVAADSVDQLIARFPDAARDLHPELMRFLFANEPKGQERRNEDRRIALARIGYGGDTANGDWLAADAVDILMRRGDTAAAGEMLRHIDEPRAVEDMLIQKRYAALWPQLEQLAGPHLEKIRKSSAEAAERSYAQDPDDHEKLQNLANALRHAGMLDQAIALRSKLPQSREAMSAADEQMGWAVNNVALALHEAGRVDEADRLFEMLNEAPMPREYWRISMKINRLELLVLNGKFDKALPLIEPTARTEGSDYADQLVRRLRYCTLNRLGRTEEAAKHLRELLAHSADAPGPTVDGLLCSGQVDKAEELALAALRERDEKKRAAFEGDFVRQLQRQRLTSDDPSVWQERWQELRRRPAIAREFERLGRDMPETLLARTAVKPSS